MERADLEQWKSREVARLLALVETERRYWQEIVSTLPVALAVLNPQRYIVSANRAFRSIYGLRSADLRTRTIDDVLAGVSGISEMVGEALAIASPLTAPRTKSVVYRGHRLRVSLLPHRDWDDDTKISLLIALEDLGEQTGLEVAPPPAAPVVVPVAAPVGIPAVAWSLSRESRKFTYLSESIVRFVPSTPATAAEWPFFERIAELDRDAVKDHYEHILRHAIPNSVYSCEFRLASVPGRWYRESARVDTDALHGVLTEITERRTLEEHQVQSQRVDALVVLAGRIAHDLNNPLMIVSGYGEELLASLPECDSRRKDLQQILEATDRIGDLAASLQAFSRKPALLESTSTIDLQAELTAAVERMKEVAGSGLTVDYTALTSRLMVVGERHGLQSLIFELTAALSDTSTVHVAIRARAAAIQDMAFHKVPHLAPGVGAVLLLENRDPQLVTQRKSPLFESPLPGKEPRNDSGNTLARAFRQVEAWGGSMWVSADQRTVRILLRGVEGSAVVEQEPDVTPAVAQPMEESEPPPPKPAPIAKRILVVDDEVGIRSLMRKILLREGYAVAEAVDAAEAIEYVRQQPIDLLLTDVVMPGVNGRELAEQVLLLRPAVKVLYVSGFTGETAVESGNYPPGSMWLQKPFTLGSLLRKAKEILETD